MRLEIKDNYSSPEAYQLMHDGAIALAQVERNGICIDMPYLQRAMSHVEGQIKKADRKLKKSKTYAKWKRMYGSNTNIDSPAQMTKVLDIPNAQESTLETLNMPFIKTYLKSKKLKKLLATNLKGILREARQADDGLWYIHPFFNLHTTQTYRSSSDRINFQNQPVRIPWIAKLIRRCFVPRGKDRCIVEIDYGGIEVAIAACYHLDPVMLDYLNDETKDMHRDTAMEIYKIKDTADVSKAIRHAAKNQFVFPEFYGSYYKQCAPELWQSIDRMNFEIASTGQSVKDHLRAKGIRSLGDCDHSEKPRQGTFEHHLANVEDSFWNKRFKVYSKWKRDWFDDYNRYGGFRTKTGFWIGGVMGRNDVINYPVQGAAFHCLLRSLINIVNWLNSSNVDALVIGQIHDSIVMDVHVDVLDTVLSQAYHIMVTELKDDWDWIVAPLKIEAEVSPPGRSWYEKKVTEIVA